MGFFRKTKPERPTVPIAELYAPREVGDVLRLDLEPAVREITWDDGSVTYRHVDED